MESADLRPQQYDDVSDPQVRMGLELIESFLQPGRGQVILDLGCGTGQLAIHLARAVGADGRVIAVDPEQGRIKFARRAAATAGVTNVEFVCGMVDAVISYGPFDAILCNMVLHWIPEKAILLTLQTARQCLKPSCSLAVNLVQCTSNFTQALTYAAMGKSESEDAAIGLCLRPDRFWLDMFADAGFVLKHVRQYNEGQTTFPNIPAFLKFMKSHTNGLVNADQIPEEKLESLLKGHGIDMNAEYNQRVLLLEIVAENPA